MGSFFYNLYKKMECSEHSLLYLFLELTGRCNLNCLHCGSDCKKESSREELTTESWLSIINYIRERFGPEPTFVITGGEPLLHPDLLTIGEQIKSLGMRWGMVTNGFALNEPLFARLLAAGLTSITVSLDGLEESHDRLRGRKGSFSRARAALDLIGRSEVELADAVTCVHPGNLPELDRVAEELIALNIKGWRLFRIFSSGRAGENNQLFLSPEQFGQLLAWLKEQRPFYQKKGLTINAGCEGWLPYARDREVRATPFFCRSGINFASILADGTVTGCSNNHPRFHQGNILESDFAYLWQNKFREMRDRGWVKKSDCRNCRHLKKCEGNSIHLWQDAPARPTFCYMEEKI